MQRLYRFLASKNPDAARRAVAAIRSQVRILETQHALGRAFAESNPEYRTWPIGFGESGYIVLYRFDSRHVPILALRHQREAGF